MKYLRLLLVALVATPVLAFYANAGCRYLCVKKNTQEEKDNAAQTCLETVDYAFVGSIVEFDLPDENPNSQRATRHGAFDPDKPKRAFLRLKIERAIKGVDSDFLDVTFPYDNNEDSCTIGWGGEIGQTRNFLAHQQGENIIVDHDACRCHKKYVFTMD